jgi:putative ABC transport system ATP-binding protein
MSEPVIVRGKNVWKVYESEAGNVEALRGIDVTINQGEMVAVMGPSGCGKTTFLNCFSGLDDVTKGTVHVEGTNIHAMNDNKKSEYRARRMGFVFQSYNLLPVLSAVENVELPLLVAGVPPKKARSRALHWLEELGLKGKEDYRPLALSGGQQQRVTLARALVSEPAIVWADEPTGNLDAENSRQVMELLRSLNQAHDQTFIVVTHDAEVARSCDRVLRMRDGSLLPP